MKGRVVVIKLLVLRGWASKRSFVTHNNYLWWSIFCRTILPQRAQIPIKPWMIWFFVWHWIPARFKRTLAIYLKVILDTASDAWKKKSIGKQNGFQMNIGLWKNVICICVKHAKRVVVAWNVVQLCNVLIDLCEYFLDLETLFLDKLLLGEISIEVWTYATIRQVAEVSACQNIVILMVVFLHPGQHLFDV